MSVGRELCRVVDDGIGSGATAPAVVDPDPLGGDRMGLATTVPAGATTRSGRQDLIGEHYIFTIIS